MQGTMRARGCAATAAISGDERDPEQAPHTSC
jgi:hypothetical protein